MSPGSSSGGSGGGINNVRISLRSLNSPYSSSTSQLSLSSRSNFDDSSAPTSPGGLDTDDAVGGVYTVTDEDSIQLSTASLSASAGLPISPRLVRSLSGSSLSSAASASTPIFVSPAMLSLSSLGSVSPSSVALSVAIAAGNAASSIPTSAVSSPASSPSFSAPVSPSRSPSLSLSLPASAFGISTSPPSDSAAAAALKLQTALAAAAAAEGKISEGSLPKVSLGGTSASASLRIESDTKDAIDEAETKRTDNNEDSGSVGISSLSTAISGGAAVAGGPPAGSGGAAVHSLSTRFTSAANEVEESKVSGANEVITAATVDVKSTVSSATAASGSTAQASVVLANVVASSSSSSSSSMVLSVTAIASSLPRFYKPGTGSISLGTPRKLVSGPAPPLLPSPTPPPTRSEPYMPSTTPAAGRPVRSLPKQSLEEVLPSIIELFKRHNAATATPINPLVIMSKAKQQLLSTSKGKSGAVGAAAVAGGSKNNNSTLGTRRGSTTKAELGGAAAAASDDDIVDPVLASEPHRRVNVVIAGATVSWEEAHLAMAVDHFAAITKPICGLPSFFAAPLFRRIKATFAGTTGRPVVTPEWLQEAQATADAISATASSASSTPVVDNDTSGANTVKGGGGAVASRSTSSGKGRPGATGSQASSSAAAAGGMAAVGKGLENKNNSTLNKNNSGGGGGGKAPLGSSTNNATNEASSPSSVPCAVLHYEPAVTNASSDNIVDRDTTGVITLPQFMTFWRAEMEPCDITERFFRVVKQRKARAIEPADLMPFLEELLAYHPGLAFLENTSEFQEKYARTVIARVFFACDPTAKQVVDLRALRNSNVVAAFALVDIEEDINQVHNYFSYEHFYVLYCKFWELDTDHDFQLTRADLSKMHSLTPSVLDRVMARAGRPFTAARDKSHMGYEDFCIFFMASEDKTTPQVSFSFCSSTFATSKQQ